MFEWQDRVMETWLGVNLMGRWTAPTCGLSVPRQNGKTLGLVMARIVYGMLVLGEQVIYTSHLQKTSTETFEGIRDFFESRAMRRYVQEVKTALGRESVALTNGARIKFLARTRNGGRGQHGDLLVFDEALELDGESQASFLPAVSASANPQTIYASTPPTYKSPGSVFREIRQRAIGGESASTAWAEWSVEEIGDVTDRARWYATNPSMGALIQEDTVAGECEQMPADAFAVERLGWWFPLAKADAAIDVGSWAECRAEKGAIPTEGVVCYAVKFAPDGSTGSLAVCCRPDGGAPYVQCIAQRSMGGGVGWFESWIAAREDKAAQVVVDGKSYGGALLERLSNRGFSKLQLMAPKAGEVATACAMFVDMVESRGVLHGGQTALDDAVSRCRKRRIGSDGGFGFEPNAPDADATPVEACALALWAAMTTKRDQRRKARVG